MIKIKLRPKEQLFCFYYAKLQNSKEAALKAGFSPLTAELQGDRLLQQDNIQAYIREIAKEQVYDDLLQKVISGLIRLAFSPTNDCVSLLLKNKQELMDKLDTLDLFTISEIKTPKDGCMEIKFFDRYKALDKLIELVQTQSNKSEANEFFQALEAGATLLKKGDMEHGV